MFWRLFPPQPSGLMYCNLICFSVFCQPRQQYDNSAFPFLCGTLLAVSICEYLYYLCIGTDSLWNVRYLLRSHMADYPRILPYLSLIPILLTHSLPCPTKVGHALSPSRHTRMPKDGMLKISGFYLLQVKRNIP
jgi:hypothetical protein